MMSKNTPNHQARVLIVDDEEGIRVSLRRVLMRAGIPSHHICHAGSGEDALAILADEPFNLVLSDYRMGGMNGVELLHRVHEEYPTTSRVLMTGYNEEHIAIDAINGASVDGYVKKPWDSQALVENLGRLLEAQRREAAKEQALQRAKSLTAAAKGATATAGSVRRLSGRPENGSG